MTDKVWTVELEEDPVTGDLLLPLNQEMLTAVGWDEGDVIDWEDNKDGSWTLVKKPSETVK